MIAVDRDHKHGAGDQYTVRVHGRGSGLGKGPSQDRLTLGQALACVEHYYGQHKARRADCPWCK